MAIFQYPNRIAKNLPTGYPAAGKYSIPRQPDPNTPATSYSPPPNPTPVAPPNPQASTFSLSRQPNLTQGQDLAEQQNTQGLATGRFADVESARGGVDRGNALRTSQALQAARGTVARSGGDFSPEAAAHAQDQALAGADSANLSASNGVNQMERQYRNDALTRAGTYEQNAETAANNERNYQTGRADTTYNRGYQQSQDANANNRYNVERQDKLGQQNFENTYQNKVLDTNTSQWNTKNAQDVAATTRKNAMDFINSLPEGPARNAAYAKYINGEDPQQISGEIYNPTNGQVNDQYVGQNPDQLDVKALTQHVKSLHPDWNQGQIDAEVQSRRIANDTSTTGVANTANSEAAAQAAITKSNSGQPLTGADEKALLESGKAPTLANPPDSQNFDASQYMGGAAPGLVKVGNKIAKLVPITEGQSGFGFKGTAYQIGGKQYIADRGKWYSWNGKTRTEVSDPTN